VVSRTGSPGTGVASSKQQCEVGRAAAQRDTSPESERALLPTQVAKRRTERRNARRYRCRDAEAFAKAPAAHYATWNGRAA